ncbi:MAG: purine phosphorylase [Rhodospirillales bacterium]|nr:purine phosphorylase [Rhodospirillales bacterium]
MTVVGVIVGLASEARLLREGAGLRIACSGASAARARGRAAGLVDSGCEALLSFGLAGGLDPRLSSGALCIPEAVLVPSGRRVPVDAAWRARLLEHAGNAGHAGGCTLLAGRDEPAGSPEEKAELFARTGAGAIDMESHAMAELAAARGVPFLVIRAIADPAERRLPPWLSAVIGADGRPLPRPLLTGLAAHPGDLPALLRLGGDARRALKALRRVAAGAGPLLAFDG